MTALRNTRGVTIRQARQADEQRLREIAFAAKASWGYDRHRVARWADTRRPFGQATEGDETGSRAERNRFYERMGGKHIANGEPNEWGRVLPIMTIAVRR